MYPQIKKVYSIEFLTISHVGLWAEPGTPRHIGAA